MVLMAFFMSLVLFHACYDYVFLNLSLIVLFASFKDDEFLFL